MTGATDILTIDVSRLCVWTADLPELAIHHDAFEEDVNQMLSVGDRNEAAYGEQTSTNLHLLTAAHWKTFFSAVRDVVTRVVETSDLKIDESRVHLRAWASRLGGCGDDAASRQRMRLNALHNHSPAFLSAIYYLRLPSGLDGGEGGTFFVNPFPQSPSTPAPGTVVTAAEGRIVVFPSWLMHGPLILDHQSFATPRIVIAVDAHFIPA